jgi:hypothetical protein
VGLKLAYPTTKKENYCLSVSLSLSLGIYPTTYMVLKGIYTPLKVTFRAM